MFEAFALLVGLKSLASREHNPVVPEPEFVPFKFPEQAAAAAPVALAPRTLEQLGVPGSLAREMEFWLHLTGRTQGDKVVGYTFRTTDGASHALRLSKVPAEAAAESPSERAA
jgi:hypothetical protein